MNFCLPKHLVDTFLEKIKTGEIAPDKLAEMTSEERRTFFTSFLGETNAQKINALFESKLLLQNQQLGIINWAKQVTGIKPAIKRDMLSRVQKMTEILQPKDMDRYLSDLVNQRLGIGVTMEEAGKIADLAKAVSDKKALIPEDSPNGSKERIEYGTALNLFKDYTGQLKLQAKKPTIKQEPLQYTWKMVEDIAGATKSMLASLDNSFFGRQGLPVLINHPKIWANNFIKSWGDIGKELKGIDAITPIKADVWSRNNALNGKYQKLKLDIGIESEEAFPSALPEKIPLFKRLYKASESAYNGAALRMRADIADLLIPKVEEAGVDLAESGLGRLINSMTGRGGIHLTGPQHKAVNVLVFSIKYFKSQVDILTAHLFDPKMDPVVKKRAATNLLKIVATMATVLGIAKILDEDSVDFDPRTAKFGKIMVGRKHEIPINISAGMGSIITLASRITPTKHKGEWGLWTKTINGKLHKTQGIGQLLANFAEGKLAPLPRTIMDSLEGKSFGGEKFTVTKGIVNLMIPLPISNIYEIMKSSAGADPLAILILSGLDMLGVNVNVYQKKKGKK